jgi:hypothetical protein
MFPDVQNLSGHIIIFPKVQLLSKFTFSCPENDLNSPENLLQIYLNLPKSRCTGNLPEIPHEQLSGVLHPPPPSEFQANTLIYCSLYFTSQNIVHHTLEHFAVVML